MTAFMCDQDVAQRVLEHIANGTTDAGEGLWREPVQNYVCPRRFADEMQRVLRRYPIPFCPSAALPTAGSYVARSAAGIPLVVVRGEDGVVRFSQCPSASRCAGGPGQRLCAGLPV